MAIGQAMAPSHGLYITIRTAMTFRAWVVGAVQYVEIQYSHDLRREFFPAT